MHIVHSDLSDIFVTDSCPFNLIETVVETTDSEVRDLFAEYGTVELISVPRSRETGQARGFAFVDMSTREELEKAVEGVNGITYGGRTLRAAESLPKDQVKKQTRMDTENGTFVMPR